MTSVTCNTISTASRYARSLKVTQPPLKRLTWHSWQHLALLLTLYWWKCNTHTTCRTPQNSGGEMQICSEKEIKNLKMKNSKREKHKKKENNQTILIALRKKREEINENLRAAIWIDTAVGGEKRHSTNGKGGRQVAVVVTIVACHARKKCQLSAREKL